MASSDSNGGKVLATAIVSLAIGILVGLVFDGGNRDDSNDQTTTEAPAQTTTTKAADFRTELSGLFREHIAVITPALRAELQKDADLTTLQEAVDNNSLDIADTLNSVYS